MQLRLIISMLKQTCAFDSCIWITCMNAHNKVPNCQLSALTVPDFHILICNYKFVPEFHKMHTITPSITKMETFKCRVNSYWTSPLVNVYTHTYTTILRSVFYTLPPQDPSPTYVTHACISTWKYVISSHYLTHPNHIVTFQSV